ncbi:MAG TPA: AAA family ATPase [Acidimicrobiales bacterium]|nr:AAA family ATPase [Acidimicrobiales bacterium]
MALGKGFVGREAVADDLSRALDGTPGRGSLVIVRGEPGIGKTRLVQEVTGRRALWGRASSDDRSGTLEPWRRVLRAARRAGIDLGSDALAIAEADASAPADAALRLKAVVEALRAIAASSNDAVVVLDDVQWADNESLAVLRSFALERDDVDLAVVLTDRGAHDRPLPRADVVLELAGLSSSSVGELIAGVTGAEPTADVVALAAARTGGNPLFVVEVARALRAAGREVEAASWSTAVPDSVLSLLASRLHELPAPTRSSLAALAVLGMESDLDLLSKLLGTDRSATLDALAPAVGAGTLGGPGTSGVAFHHALGREAVLHDLGSLELAQLHGEAARVLAADGDVRQAGAIARHHHAAGAKQEAARWARRAGDLASAAARHDEAVGWYRMALVAEDDAAADLLVSLAESLSRVGELDDARVLFGEAAAAARAHGDATLLARAALGIGTLGGSFEVRMLDATQVALLEEAGDRLGDRASALRAGVLARLSVALTLHGARRRRLELAEEAVEIARAVGDDRTLVVALGAWCDAHAGPEDLDARLGATRDQLAAAIRLGDPELLLLSHRFRIVALMEAGDLPSATAEVRSYADVAKNLRVPAFRWYAWVAQGMLALLHGDVDEAERFARLAIDDGERAGSANAMMLAKGALLAAVHRERGDAELFLATLAEGNAGLPEAQRGFPHIYPLFLIGYGTEVPEAAALVDQLPDDLSFVDGDALGLLVWTLLGTAAAYVGDRSRAERALAHLEPYADRLVLDGTASVCLGPVAGTLARLLASVGRYEEADRMYERAIATCRRLGAPLLLARLEAERRDGPPRLSRDGARVHGGQPHESEPPVNRFVREGATWLVTYRGSSARLRDSKGLRDLAVLLARPGREVHVLNLIAAADGVPDGPARRPSQADLGPNVDAAARSAYEQRIRDLTELLEEAEANNDFARAALLDSERDALLRELAGALGLSGRARPQGADAERARKAVSMRIRDAIKRVGAELPTLGRHLTNAVHTGTYCSYQPEQPITWT